MRLESMANPSALCMTPENPQASMFMKRISGNCIRQAEMKAAGNEGNHRHSLTEPFQKRELRSANNYVR
jgi:hypothetical protein